MGWIILATALSGCEIGRTMFQMDSNSGRPFFGVDLLPARKKTTAVSPAKTLESATAEVTPVRDNSHAVIATSSPRPSPVKVPDPTLLERLKLKRPPERIALNLQTAEDESPQGPMEEFR